MSYYAGDFYRGNRGDYYRGDPFSLGGMVGGVLKGVGGIVKAVPGIGTIVGGAMQGVGNIIAPARLPTISSGFMMPFPQPQEGARVPGGTVVKTPGVGGVISRILPGGETGYMIRRRKRMNVTNPRALRRAIRRVSGFGKLVQRSKRAIARANSAVGNKSRASTRKRGR
jgi:hypothetical protein